MRSNRPKYGAHWTVLIIPGRYGKVTNLRIPGWLLRLAAGAAVAILVFSTCLLVYSLKLRTETQQYARQYEEVNATNRLLREEITRLKQAEEAIREKVQAVERLDKQVRELLGLSSGKSSSLEDEGGSMGGGISLGGAAGVREGWPEGFASACDPGPTGACGVEGDEWLKTVRGIATGFDELNPLLERQVDGLEQLKKQVIARQRYLAAVPTTWPVRGRITSRFGYRQSPFGGGREFHDGLDIAAPIGAPVVAAGSGQVSFSGWLTGYGRTVIVDHGYGYRTQYSHNSSLLVERGEAVRRGEVIARVGSTGRSTGPHLHFMILVRGRLVDPLEVLP